MTESGSRKFDGDLEYVARGIPSGAKFRTVQGNEVFRHYTTSDENRSQIILTSSLVAGNLPYITKGGGIRTSYTDLTGVFLTRPSFKPEQIGVSKASAFSYVDLLLPRGTEILELEPGIILIPGPGSTPGWLKTYYETWGHSQNTVPNYVHGAMKRLDEQGGISQPLEQPILILKQ